MTQIIGFAGKKQSGKNTSCNFVQMLKIKEYGISQDIRINIQTGELEIKDILGQTVNDYKWFPFSSKYVNIEALYETVGPFCKIYALADALKSIAIHVFGLPKDKVYGTDADKEELTYLLWENMPGVTTEPIPQNPINEEVAGQLGKYYEKVLSGVVYHEPGQMTIREVFQFLGTDIFRKMYDRVWVDTLLRTIEAEQPEVAAICDVRFPNEMTLLREKGASIIGLTRNSDSKDTHASEQIHFGLCDLVIDNQNMDIEAQCEAIYKAMMKLGCKNIPKILMGV